MAERTAETNWRISREDFSGVQTPLEMRRYEARRRASNGSWNAVGRRYVGAKALYNLIRTPGVFPEFADGELDDIQAYEAVIQERSKRVTSSYK